MVDRAGGPIPERMIGRCEPVVCLRRKDSERSDMWPFTSTNQKKKGSSRKSTRKSASASSSWSHESTRRGLGIVAAVSLVVAVLVGWNPAERALRGYLTSRDPLPVASETVDLVDRPAWMSPAIAADLQRLVAERLTEDRLDQRGVAIAAEALGASAWIRSVDRIRRLADGGAEVVASYREPVAVVEAPGGYAIVDREGVRLPGVYRRVTAERLNLPMITGVTSFMPEPGTVWQGHEIVSGIKLALLVENEPFADQVVSFDVSERDRMGRLRLVMHTERGQVRWGLPPGEETPYEQPAEEKLSVLRQVASESGRIDAGGQILEVYMPTPVMRKNPAN